MCCESLAFSELYDKCFILVIQILVQHIKTVLPGLKARISAALVSVAKEHASYGEITESKVCFFTIIYYFYLIGLLLLIL